MGFFPNLSNVYSELQELLQTRAQKTNSPWTEGGVSGLSTWIRLISSVDSGLVMESVHSPESFQTRYGNVSEPGILGYELDMRTPVKIDGVGRGLRPSPIITSFSMDESAEGAPRVGKFTIVCYTKEQTDKLVQYLLEPSFHVLVEFGWNVNDSWRQRVGGGGPIDPCDIAAYNQWATVKQKRIDSKFQYDAMLGIITGGGITFGEGETYNLEVQITGIGNVAEYMQTHRSGNPTNRAKNDSSLSFSPNSIAADAQSGNIGAALFKQCFNALPNQKKTAPVYNWFEQVDSESGNFWAYEGNFFNFDESIKEYLQEWLTKGRDIRSSSGEELKIPTDTPLFDEERFIRFEFAIALLNAYSFSLKPEKATSCNTESMNLQINIRDTVCSAFPHMFSTDKSKLYIPNTMAPNFNLRSILTDPKDTEQLEYINFENLNDSEFQTNLHPIVQDLPQNDPRSERNGTVTDQATGQGRPVPFAFPARYPLDGEVLRYDCDETVKPITEDAYFWGWLKDLYINFDFFAECISKPNYVVRDVFYDLLNGMSSACNSIWKFQIIERPIPNDPKGARELTVVDMNFKGIIDSDDEDMVTFQARGTKSPFISCDFSVDTPSNMMSSVVQKKLSGGTIDGSGEGVRPLFGNVFSTDKNDQVGAILLSVKEIKEEQANQEQNQEIKAGKQKSQKELLEEAKAKAFELFANRAGVFSKVQDREGRIDITNTFLDLKSENNSVIENLLVVGTWNDPAALKQVQLIDLGLVENAQPSQPKEKTNKQNPPIGLATFNFDLHGVSGFKVGDQFRVDGLPDKFGYPNFYQVTKIDHAISGNTWITSVKGSMMLIGEE
jgi:hypothetical protein